MTLESVREAIQISKDADIPVVLTHHKVIGKPMWGKSTQTLSLVDSARIVEEMEEKGIVSAPNTQGKRELL